MYHSFLWTWMWQKKGPNYIAKVTYCCIDRELIFLIQREILQGGEDGEEDCVRSGEEGSDCGVEEVSGRQVLSPGPILGRSYLRPSRARSRQTTSRCQMAHTSVSRARNSFVRCAAQLGVQRPAKQLASRPYWHKCCTIEFICTCKTMSAF